MLRVVCLPALACALAGAAACHAEPADDDSGDESSSSTGEPVPVPAFLNPAVGSFQVAADQIEPETFVLQNAQPGVTQVLLDGYSLGSPSAADPVGTLTETSLALTLRGALTVGSHSLQLLTDSPDGPLYSVELEMQIVAADELKRPVWAAELAPDPVATGQILFSSGVGASGLLGLISPGAPDPEVRLLRAEAGGWASAEPVVLPLEGHVLQLESFAPAVSAVAFPEPDGGAPKRMRVAYNVGWPGAAIVTRDIRIDPSPIVLDPVIAFDLDSALGGAKLEWAAFGRPVALGHNLVAELHAAPDAEQPHPGDHRLIASFWRGDELRWTPPQQIGTATPSDLDALGSAAVLSDIPQGSARALSVRLGGAFPALLELADGGAISLTTPPQTAALDLPGDITLATVVGNFGSRTVAAIDRHGRFSLRLLDTSHGNPPHIAAARSASLPVATVTGPLAAGVGRGYPFFLVPYGDEFPVHVVASDGEAYFTQPIPDLHCDAVALAITLTGNDPELAAVPLACLSGGELRLGSVTLAASSS